MDAAKCLASVIVQTPEKKKMKEEESIVVAETMRRRQRGSGGVRADRGEAPLGTLQLNAPTEMSRWPFANYRAPE